MKFIRKNGHIIPIKDNGESKRYGAKRELPKEKRLYKEGAIAGAIAAGAMTIGIERKVSSAGSKLSKIQQLKSLKPTLSFGKLGSLKALAFGAAIGGVLGATAKYYKRGKGESMKQLAKRASGNDYKKKGKSSV
jgi:hypothetical protein